MTPVELKPAKVCFETVSLNFGGSSDETANTESLYKAIVPIGVLEEIDSGDDFRFACVIF